MIAVVILSGLPSNVTAANTLVQNSFERWANPGFNTWFVVTGMTHVQLRDWIHASVPDVHVMVAKLAGECAWIGSAMDQTGAWIKDVKQFF